MIPKIILQSLLIFQIPLFLTLSSDLTSSIGCIDLLLLASGNFCINQIICSYTYMEPGTVLKNSMPLQETLHNHSSKDLEQSDSHYAVEGMLDESNLPGKNKVSQSQKSLLKNWPLMSSIIVYCIFQLHDMAYTEVIHMKTFYLLGFALEVDTSSCFVKLLDVSIDSNLWKFLPWILLCNFSPSICFK